MAQPLRIVSASRRTDIPALYPDWFLHRLEAGFCLVKNPYGPQIQRVSLRPEEVAGIVFWTRNPGPLLPHLGDLRAAGFDHYFFVTINDYPREIEPRRPDTVEQIRRFRACAELTGGRVFWRYDPIVLSAATPPAYHERKMAELAAQLAGATSRCYISFAVWYRKTASNLHSIDRTGAFGFVDPATEARRTLAVRLREIAAQHGIQLYSCSQDALAKSGIEKAHCTDARLFPKAAGVKGAPLRPDCGCWHSVDIGAYDTCAFGCRYCYATRSDRAAHAKRALFDPHAAMLCRPDVREVEKA